MEMRFSDTAAEQAVPGLMPVFGYKRLVLPPKTPIPPSDDADFAVVTKLLKGRVLFHDWSGRTVEADHEEFEKRYRPYHHPSSDLDIPERPSKNSWTLHREFGNVAPFQMEHALRHFMSISGKERLLIIPAFIKSFDTAMKNAYDALFFGQGGDQFTRRNRHQLTHRAHAYRLRTQALNLTATSSV